MRNMSFSMTTPQFLDGSKDVTRRFGWWNLKPGDRVMAVEKAMGLKKGEKIKRLGEIEIVTTTKEQLGRMRVYPENETAREGFPKMSVDEFIWMLCDHSGKGHWDFVNRIEFKRVSA